MKPIVKVAKTAAAGRFFLNGLGCLALIPLVIGLCGEGAHLVARPAQTSERVSFRNGDVILGGTLHLPGGSGRHPAIVAFHAANGPTRDFHAYLHLAAALPAAGFAVLLFDRRGSGASGGDFDSATFRDLAADGIAAVSFLKSRADIDPARIGVWGISQGGWLAPLAATMSSDVAFVVSVSGPGVGPARQMDYYAEYALRSAGGTSGVIDRALRVRAVVNEFYRGRAERSDAELAVGTIRSEPWFGQVFLPNSGNLPADPKRTKWYATMDYAPLDALARARVPMAFFFAETDDSVPVEESIANIRRVTRSNPAVMISRVPKTDHFMETGQPASVGLPTSDPPTSSLYVKQLLKWLHNRVPH